MMAVPKTHSDLLAEAAGLALDAYLTQNRFALQRAIQAYRAIEAERDEARLAELATIPIWIASRQHHAEIVTLLARVEPC